MTGGHTTEAPDSITYYSVVSCTSIFIGLLLAYLNGLEITAIDLENAYLNVPCAEKVWFVGGVLIIVLTLYGLKSAGLSWISALAVASWEIGLNPMMTDPNV